jgi:hypothetical protein
MEYQTIVIGADRNSRPVQGRIGLLAEPRWMLQPAVGTARVCLLRQESLAPLLERRDLFVDRGCKHESESLSRKLLGERLVPILDTTYASGARLLGSVRKFLRTAEGMGERQTYLLGIPNATFEQLWDSVAAAPADDPATYFEPTPALAEADPDELLSHSLARRATPKVLKQAFIGDSPFARLMHQLILRAANVSAPVLIVGESGTGKEIIARQIHAQSAREKQPFMAVN